MHDIINTVLRERDLIPPIFWQTEIEYMTQEGVTKSIGISFVIDVLTSQLIRNMIDKYSLKVKTTQNYLESVIITGLKSYKEVNRDKRVEIINEIMQRFNASLPQRVERAQFPWIAGLQSPIIEAHVIKTILEIFRTLALVGRRFPGFSSFKVFMRDLGHPLINLSATRLDQQALLWTVSLRKYEIVQEDRSWSYLLTFTFEFKTGGSLSLSEILHPRTSAIKLIKSQLDRTLIIKVLSINEDYSYHLEFNIPELDSWNAFKQKFEISEAN